MLLSFPGAQAADVGAVQDTGHTHTGMTLL